MNPSTYVSLILMFATLSKQEGVESTTISSTSGELSSSETTHDTDITSIQSSSLPTSEQMASNSVGRNVKEGSAAVENTQRMRTPPVEDNGDPMTTLPSSIVTVALVLILSTSVLHCLFILHYIIKIWYYCKSREVDDENYDRQSVFGLGDYDRASLRRSLRKQSVILRKKKKPSDVESYRENEADKPSCSTDNYQAGFLNLDRAINQGRHSKRISCNFDDVVYDGLNRNGSSSLKYPENETITEENPEESNDTDRSSMLVPTIRVESPRDSNIESYSDIDRISFTSVSERLENSIKKYTGASSKEADILSQRPHEIIQVDLNETGAQDQDTFIIPSGRISVNSSISELHDTRSIDKTGYCQQDIQWHVIGNEVENVSDPGNTKGCVVTLEGSARSRSPSPDFKNLGEPNKPTKRQVSFKLKSPAMEMMTASEIPEYNTSSLRRTHNKMEGSVPIRRSVDLSLIHQQQTDKTRRFSSFETTENKLFQNPRQQPTRRSVHGEKAGQLLLRNCRGPETSV